MSPVTRPIARRVAIAALLLLGAMAASRSRLTFLPASSFPELEVGLRVPAAGDLDDFARRWLAPLESAIRAGGGVVALAGEADPAGADLRVRLRAGVDVERKAARLESELAALRRRLPEGGLLAVRPVGQAAGESSVIVWLGDDDHRLDDHRLDDHRLDDHRLDDHRLDDHRLETLRELPAVRSVTVAGEDRRELRVRPRAVDLASGEELAAAIDRGLAGRLLGAAPAGDRRLPVFVAGQGRRPLAGMTASHHGRPLPLGALAEFDLGRRWSALAVRAQGRRGRVLLIAREADASPLALGRSLRRSFEALGLGGRTRTLFDEAAPLRRLLRRLALGLAAATAVTFLMAWLLSGARRAAWLAAALPLAAAAAAQVLWWADLPLDVTTLPAAMAGLAAALLAVALRTGKGALSARRLVAVGLASAAILPVTVALAGGMLAPLLAAPARAFLLTVAAALPALLLLPRLAVPAPGWLTGPLRWALRNPWSVLLGSFAAAYLAFAISGRALAPRSGSLAPPISDLVIRLRFAEGATRDQAEGRVRAVEAHLDATEELGEHWSVFGREGGAVYVKARRGDRALARLRALARRLQAQLASGGASVTVRPLVGEPGEELGFGGGLEDRAETDGEASFYRFILRHPEASVLRAVHGRAVDRLAKLEYSLWQDQIHTDWGPPATRLEWIPRAGSDPLAVAEGVRRLALASSFPAARPLPSRFDVDLRILDPRAPADPGEIRQRVELLGLQAADRTASGRPLAPSALFELREVIASQAMKRQSGRFVVPVTLRITGSREEVRRVNREAIDRALATLPLPEGVDLERPEPNPALWSRERLRMVAIAAALPCLMLAVAVCRLDSFAAGLAALLPALLGVLAAAPCIQAVRGHVDELTLLALAAAAVASLPWSLEAAAAISGRWRRDRSPPRRLAGGFTYRWLARRAPGWAVALPAALVLAVVPGLGLDGERQPWVLPLRAAGIVIAVASAASLLGLPVLLRALRRLGRRRRGASGEPSTAVERARPPAWRGAGAADLELSARRVAKIYAGGFTALRAVSFRLEPGVVGLLGPNGAGKTTLLRLLCGLLEPTRGRVYFRGVAITPDNLPEYRRRVGYLPQDFNAYEGFTGARFLDYWAIEKGLDEPRERRREVERRLAQVGLEDAAGRRVRDYSGGMRRRIGIARALLGSPPIVIVDEPTTGLDIEARNRLRESLLAVAGERIILFSTHIASDVAAAAARILLLHRGHLLYDGAASGLIRRARGRVFETEIGDGELRDFSARYRVTARVRTLAGIRVRALAGGDGSPAGPLVEPHLEEAYLATIGEAEGGVIRAGRNDAASLLDLSAVG